MKKILILIAVCFLFMACDCGNSSCGIHGNSQSQSLREERSSRPQNNDRILKYNSEYFNVWQIRIDGCDYLVYSNRRNSEGNIIHSGTCQNFSCIYRR